MQVYAQLDALLPHNLYVDVVQASSVPHGVAMQAALLLECVHVPKLDAEPEGWMRRELVRDLSVRGRGVRSIALLLQSKEVLFGRPNALLPRVKC